ncbi:hypothetical protein [Melittangium boletus]|uniref:hypothetical protein n=1 Tax=Melittangium boletus TaxID=83453 RepID=UPI003DA4C66C
MGLGLLLVIDSHPRVERRNAPYSAQPMENDWKYFAERSSECGMELLSLARSEGSGFEHVIPVGRNQPNERLRRNVWELGRFMLKGHFTGKSRTIPECATFREFEIFDFKPWGDIQRCSMPGALNPEMLLSTDKLPVDRYVPEDFIDGPFPPSIDDATCRLIGACAIDMRSSFSRGAPDRVIDSEELPSLDGSFCHPEVSCQGEERRVHSCSGDVWCCRLLPEDVPGE